MAEARAGKYKVERYFGDVSGQDGVTEVEAGTLEVRLFPEGTQPGKTGMSLGISVDAGKKFEIAKTNVWIEMPCYKEEADDAHEYCESFVSEKLNASIGKIRAMAAKRRGKNSDSGTAK